MWYASTTCFLVQTHESVFPRDRFVNDLRCEAYRKTTNWRTASFATHTSSPFDPRFSKLVRATFLKVSTVSVQGPRVCPPDASTAH